jgi:hypothetical protein
VIATVASKKDTHPAVQDSRPGQFVKKGEAKRHPATTETERIPNPGKGKRE